MHQNEIFVKNSLHVLKVDRSESSGLQKKSKYNMSSKFHIFTPAHGLNPFTAMMSTENDQQKFETRQLFFFSAQACERIVVKTHGIASRCVIGPENMLSVHFQPFYELGQ